MSNLLLQIDQKKCTAKLLRITNVGEKVIIPRFINYKSKDYMISSLSQSLFENNENIEVISFDENSCLEKINKKAFSCTSISKIKIPSSVKKISKAAFYFCSNLAAIEFAQNSQLESIGYEAFSGTSIFHITFPSSLKNIGERSFFYCQNIQSVEFPSNSQLITIASEAFSGTSISYIKIPSSCQKICEGAFSSCEKLNTIEIPIDSDLRIIENEAFAATLIDKIFIPSKCNDLQKGCFTCMLFLNEIQVSPQNKSFIFVDNTFLLGKTNEDFDVLLFVRHEIEKVIFPSFIKKIGYYAFERCKLKAIQFNNDCKLETIDEFSFYNSSIESIIIPPSVTSIKKSSFAYCKQLKTFEFSQNSNIISLKRFIFDFSGIEILTLPPKIEYIENGLFNTMKYLKEINLSSSNKKFLYLNNSLFLEKTNDSDSFDQLIFARRNIEYIIVPSCVKRICEYAFAHSTKLKTIEFLEDSKLQIIEKDAFNESSITNISIPSSVTTICDSCFSICSKLKTLKFNDNSKISTISSQMFAVSSINHIIIPSSVNRIESMAFNYCNFLQTLECLGDSLVFGSECFNDCGQLFLISFPNSFDVTFKAKALNGIFKDCIIFVPSFSNIKM